MRRVFSPPPSLLLPFLPTYLRSYIPPLLDATKHNRLLDPIMKETLIPVIEIKETHD